MRLALIRPESRTSLCAVHGPRSRQKMGGRAYPRAGVSRLVPMTWLCLVSPLPRRPGGRGFVRAEFVEAGRAKLLLSRSLQAGATDVAPPRQCSHMRLLPWSLLRPLSGVGFSLGRSTRGRTTPGSHVAPPSGGAGQQESSVSRSQSRTSLRAVHGSRPARTWNHDLRKMERRA